MSHERKKDGQRKDKKNERMREDVALRKAMAEPPRPTHDQVDIVDYKQGSHSDTNRQPHPNQP